MQNKYLESIVELYGEDFHIVSAEISRCVCMHNTYTDVPTLIHPP